MSRGEKEQSRAVPIHERGTKRTARTRPLLQSNLGRSVLLAKEEFLPLVRKRIEAPPRRVVIVRSGSVARSLAVGGHLVRVEDVACAAATRVLSAMARSADDSIGEPVSVLFQSGRRRGKGNEKENLRFNILAKASLGGVGVVGHVAASAPAGRVDGRLDGRRLEVLGREVGSVGIIGHVAGAATSVRVDHVGGVKVN